MKVTIECKTDGTMVFDSISRALDWVLTKMREEYIVVIYNNIFDALKENLLDKNKILFTLKTFEEKYNYLLKVDCNYSLHSGDKDILEYLKELIDIDIIYHYPRKPKYCYSIHPSREILIRVDYGKKNYMPYVNANTNKSIGGKRAIELKRKLNADLGVNEEVEEAMLAGSMFGWHIPLVRELFGE